MIGQAGTAKYVDLRDATAAGPVTSSTFWLLAVFIYFSLRWYLYSDGQNFVWILYIEPIA